MESYLLARWLLRVARAVGGLVANRLTQATETAARFTLNDAPFMAIAGIWRGQTANLPPAFAMLTTAPGPDGEPIHNRQVAVLRPDDWKAWIYLKKLEADLLRPLPGESLHVETVRIRRS